MVNLAARRGGRFVARFAARPQFWMLGALLVLLFLFGGGSRSDVAPLVFLRPIAVMMLFAGVLTVERAQLRANRMIVGLCAATALLVAAHLVPLPPAVWHDLPGRELIARIDLAAGLGDVWRPLAMSPASGLNALYSLAIPGAVILLAIQLRDEELYWMLALIVALGMVGAWVSLAQVAGASNGPLYFYRITNNGSAVGFFANRNHQALLIACLFPLLAGLAAAAPAIFAKNSLPRSITVACASLLPPLLLVTGSRSGLVTGLLGVALGLGIYLIGALTPPHERTGRQPIPQWVKISLVGGGLLLLAVVTALLSRAEAIRRVLGSDSTEDLRVKVWMPIFQAGADFMPLGSGAGSFVQAYKIIEPDGLLMPAYLNHAHNDWLEVWLTTGVAGLVLMAVALLWFVQHAFRILARMRELPDADANLTLAATAMSVIFLILIGSFLDYPLRTPAMAGLFAICAVVANRYHKRFLGRDRQDRKPRLAAAQ